MKNQTHPVSIRIKYTRYVVPILLVSFLIIGITDTLFYFRTIRESSRREESTYLNSAASALDSIFEQFTLDTSIFFYKTATQDALLKIPADQALQAKTLLQNEAPYYPYLSASYTENVFFYTKDKRLLSTSALSSETLSTAILSCADTIIEKGHKYHGLPFLFSNPDDPGKLYIARDIYQWTGKVSTAGKYYLGTLIVEPKISVFDKIFSLNNPSYQLALSDNEQQIYLNYTDLTNKEIQLLANCKQKTTIRQNTYEMRSMPLSLSQTNLFLIKNQTHIYRNTPTFIMLLLIPCILALVAMISATSFISRSIANEFDYFMKKLNETKSISKDAFIHMDSSTEFAELSSVYNQTLSRIHTLSEKIHEQELLTKNIEIENLQSQINPHFLYNTLNCISGLVDMDRKEECHQALIALADIERMSLKGKPFCKIGEDLTYVREYTYIQKLRFENNLSIIFDIPKSMQHYYIPKLVIQPLIENAVIHGTSKITGHGLIAIQGSSDDSRLQISVKDNGPGFSQEFLDLFHSAQYQKQTSSYGLHNIDRRLKLYYGNGYGLILKNNENNGACVTISIPLRITENPSFMKRSLS
ncbi:sensor histidine kinase [Blautia sp. HCP3S3_G3]|uniref:sensor histidine kinase n=1 Tax=Blautia sp. HCP3S3_G3 TaxID=3438913 RepID=UPI003F8CB836